MDKETIKSITSALDEIVNILGGSSAPIKKEAYNLFSIGDTLVCYNETEGLSKGQKYKCIEKPKQGYIIVEDLYGNQIGMFRGDRFVQDNNEY